jgi:hypothetical protein
MFFLNLTLVVRNEKRGDRGYQNFTVRMQGGPGVQVTSVPIITCIFLFLKLRNPRYRGNPWRTTRTC